MQPYGFLKKFPNLFNIFWIIHEFLFMHMVKTWLGDWKVAYENPHFNIC
jgi:hypothetical protein